MLRSGVPSLKDVVSSLPDGHRMLLHRELGSHGQLAGTALPGGQEHKILSEGRGVVHATGESRPTNMAAAPTTAHAAPRKQRQGPQLPKRGRETSETLRVANSAQPATADAISLPINYFEVGDPVVR